MSTPDAAVEAELRGRLDQLWGWAKAGKQTDPHDPSVEYYLMDTENVAKFTDHVLDLLEALKPVVVDREAVRRVLDDLASNLYDEGSAAFDRGLDSVMALVHPMPTREQIAAAVGGHDVRQRYDGPVMTWFCTCGTWSSTSPHDAVTLQADHIASLVLAALYPKATEPVCTCTVTPTLRTLDRECPVHWTPIPKATEGKP